MHTCMYLYMHTCAYALEETNSPTRLDMMCLVLFLFHLSENSMRVCRDEWVHCRRSSAPCAPRLSAFSPNQMGAAWRTAKFVALFVACILPTVNTQRPKRTRVFCLMFALVCQDTRTRVRLCTTATRHGPLMSGWT